MNNSRASRQKGKFLTKEKLFSPLAKPQLFLDAAPAFSWRNQIFLLMQPAESLFLFLSPARQIRWRHCPIAAKFDVFFPIRKNQSEAVVAASGAKNLFFLLPLPLKGPARRCFSPTVAAVAAETKNKLWVVKVD